MPKRTAPRLNARAPASGSQKTRVPAQASASLPEACRGKVQALATAQHWLFTVLASTARAWCLRNPSPRSPNLPAGAVHHSTVNLLKNATPGRRPRPATNWPLQRCWRLGNPLDLNRGGYITCWALGNGRSPIYMLFGCGLRRYRAWPGRPWATAPVPCLDAYRAARFLSRTSNCRRVRFEALIVAGRLGPRACSAGPLPSPWRSCGGPALVTSATAPP